MLERLFHLTENQTTVRRELLAGLAEEDQRVIARSLETMLGCLVDDPAMLLRLTLRDGAAES